MSNEIRAFELSLWSLQDEFITVIESTWNKTLGKTQNASIILNIDGTQELTFSIPMYYYLGGIKYTNNAWYNEINGKTLVNTRKIKVIFNKGSEKEEVYEFVIDKVTERHDNNSLVCDVECSGLAFYELGKIGYKISLTSDDFYNEDLEWFQSNSMAPQPIANIQYWLNKFLTPYSDDHAGTTIPSVNDSTVILSPTTSITDTSVSERSRMKWYYAIQMDWNATANAADYIKKSPHKIYEEDRYDNEGTLILEEKARLVDLEESNIYNLTQDLAEAFGVYCKYVYSHNEDYHIIGRTIVFYNSLLDEKNNLSITYRNQTQSISKSLDSADLITKMYVRTVEDNGEIISIIDVDENKSREDYLLNFDYLYSVGNVSEEAYNYLSNYEQIMHDLNIQLRAKGEQINTIQSQIPEVQSKQTTASDAIQLDKERIANAQRQLQDLTNADGSISINETNPDSAVLIEDAEHPGYYYIKLTRIGIQVNTLQIYRTIDYRRSSVKTNRLRDKINATPVYDEFNNLIQMKGITRDTSYDARIVYLTYDYNPYTHWNNIENTWARRLVSDMNNYELAVQELTALENNLALLTQQYEALVTEKQERIDYLGQLMGPALREGYWQPENYTDYGDVFTAKYSLTSNTNFLLGQTNYDSFKWDNQLFDGEQDVFYKIGINMQEKYYPCINLSPIWNSIRNDLSNLSFLFFDKANTSWNDEWANINNIDNYNTNTRQFLRISAFGAGARLIFVKQNNTIIPALLLLDAESYTDETLANMRACCRIGKLTTTITNNTITYNLTNDVVVTWLSGTYNAVYPRIRIESLGIKIDDNQLSIKYNNKPLKQYEDFYLSTRTEESVHTRIENDDDIIWEQISSYYFTIKPEVIIKAGSFSSLDIMFILSNASVAIYRDAVQVMKENSIPQVSYELTVDIFKNFIIDRPSQFLNRVVKINDYELQFDNVLGYVSQLTLDLDHPWQDNVEIKNYKTKYEDLFSSITAQTEEMKKISYVADAITGAFAVSGDLRSSIVQNTLDKVDLNYAFNNGKLTIDEKNGIWGTSDSGVVAFRGGGIFTSTQKNEDDKWIWNTGITPEGINANLITTGQLDTNKIKVYAGDKVRFQLNQDGLFAYKTFFSEYGITNTVVRNLADDSDGGLDPSQYVTFNEEGLFLIAKQGAYVLNSTGDDYKQISTDVKRVSVSWDGFTLRNYNNEKVFYANADTGDLILTGDLIFDGTSGSKIQTSGDLTIKAHGALTIESEGMLFIDTDNFKVNITDNNNNTLFYIGEKYRTTYINYTSEHGMEIKGKIYASNGEIGGLTLSNNALYRNMMSFDDTNNDGIYIGIEGISLGGKTGYFKVTNQGSLTVHSAIIANNFMITTAFDNDDWNNFETENYFLKLITDNAGAICYVKNLSFEEPFYEFLHERIHTNQIPICNTEDELLDKINESRDGSIFLLKETSSQGGYEYSSNITIPEIGSRSMGGLRTTWNKKRKSDNIDYYSISNNYGFCFSLDQFVFYESYDNYTIDFGIEIQFRASYPSYLSVYVGNNDSSFLKQTLAIAPDSSFSQYYFSLSLSYEEAAFLFQNQQWCYIYFYQNNGGLNLIRMVDDSVTYSYTDKTELNNFTLYVGYNNKRYPIK